MDNTELSCISFCSGYDGLSLGIRRVFPGLRTIAYAEIEEYACAVLAARMEEGQLDVAPIWTDLKTFPSELFRGKVGILTAGFPCQPVSVAGKQQADKDPRWLWPHIKRAIGVIQPGCVFLENVPGLIHLGLRGILLDLEELGYRVESDSGKPTWGLFTAAECGAPHKRERLFILADSNQQGPQGRNSRIVQECAEQLLAGPRGTQWPSRPGEPQYEWEEPRVVVDRKV